jgi:hypothetical protein
MQSSTCAAPRKFAIGKGFRDALAEFVNQLAIGERTEQSHR